MVKECSIHDIHKTCKLNMDWTAGKNTLFVLLIFSASRSRKRKEKKNKLQNGKSKEEIEKKGSPSECLNFQFMCAQMQAIKETYNVQCPTLQIDR